MFISNKNVKDLQSDLVQKEKRRFSNTLLSTIIPFIFFGGCIIILINNISNLNYKIQNNFSELKIVYDTIHKRLMVVDTTKKKEYFIFYDTTKKFIYDTTYKKITIYDTTHKKITVYDTVHKKIIVYDTIRKPKKPSIKGPE